MPALAVPGGYGTLFWEDNFEGTSLDSTYWTAENVKWPYSNELEYYTPRPENLQVTGGNLVIIAREESYGGANYTSARIDTRVINR